MPVKNALKLKIKFAPLHDPQYFSFLPLSAA